MAVTPLTNRPVPPNSNFARAMFVWVGGTAQTDPLDTDNDQQAILNFLDDANVGCNTIFLDMWRYLGGGNWTNAKRDRMKLFLDAAHRSGAKVYALCGDLGWGTNQDWVMKNIVEPYMAYQAMCTKTSEQFDGFMLDVEYWADETTYPASTNLPGLCDLVLAMKRVTNQPVGCFAAFFLKDDGTPETPRAAVTYNGKSAQDGEHLMDVCDFIAVGSYRDTAAAQIPLFQPWYDYAVQQGKNLGLYCGSETINIAPANITYFGQTKATMETEHAAISGTFKTTGNAVFLGQAVHSYDGWKAMT
jgi:hypothetical protein